MEIKNWTYRHEKLESELFDSNGAIYANLDFLLCESYNCTNKYHGSGRNPSHKFQVAILESMIKVHDSWKTQIVEMEDIYDLKLWVFSEFIKSSVALSNKDITLENESNLVACNEDFPFDRYPTIRNDLNTFSWKGYYNDSIFFESDFNKAQFAGQRRVFSREEMLTEMIKLGAIKEHVIFENGQKDVRYTIRDDNNIIWIGTKL